MLFLLNSLFSLLSTGLLSPVQSILSLILLFITSAIILFMDNFVLMGILYILIYVGAISILFLFILSLLNIDYQKEGPMSPLITTLLSVAMGPLDLIDCPDLIVEPGNITLNELTVVGTLLYTEYAILLLLTGLILILSVIGAIKLAK